LLSGCSGGPSSKSIDTVEFIWPGTSDVERAVAKDFAQSIGSLAKITYDYLSWNDMEKTLAIRIRANNPPDATMTQDVTNLVSLKALAPLDSYLAKGGAIDKSQYLPGTFEFSNIGGKQYSVPYLATAFTLLVNVDLLKQAGLTPEGLKTWDDVEKAAAKMTKGDVYGIAYPLGNPRFAFRQPLTIAYSNDLVINDLSDAAAPKWEELLGHLQRLQKYSPKAQVTWNYPDMWRAYATGKVAMVVGGTYFTANVYSINPDIVGKTREIAYPVGPSGSKPQVPVSTVGYGMFNGAKNPDTVWKLLSLLTSDKWTARMAAAVNIPAKKSITAGTLAEIAKSIYPQAISGHQQITSDSFQLVEQYGVPLVRIPGQPEMESAFQPIVLNLMRGGLSPAGARGQIYKELGAIAKQNE